ncbi:MAG: hypothetical protein AAGJ93_05440 [Bacteroidota bacterium]
MLAKVFHIILAFFLLLSSTGLLVSKHYCQGELKSMTLFFEAQSCHQPQKMKNCPMHAMLSGTPDDKEQKGCCDTQMDWLKTDLKQVINSTDQIPSFQFEANLTPLPVAITAINWHESTHPFTTYKPPLLVYELPIRLQTFLF